MLMDRKPMQLGMIECLKNKYIVTTRNIPSTIRFRHESVTFGESDESVLPKASIVRSCPVLFETVATNRKRAG